jgi:CBS domain containing-hemolysin-like protein
MESLILVVAFILVVSFFCSLCEAVLYSVPMSHIEKLVADKKRGGKTLRKLREKIDAPITAVLTINTFANTAGATIAGVLASEIFGSKGLGIFSAIMTLLILFLGEIIPKTIGVIFNRTLAGLIATPLLIMVWICKPIIWFSGFITRAISKRGHTHHVSEEDIILMARMGLRAGVLNSDEVAVIQNIFSLEEKKVSDVMTPRTVMFSLDASLTVKEAKEDHGIFIHSRIPIYDSDPEDIIGIVHRHEILRAVAEDKFDLPLKDLARPVNFVLDIMPLEKALKEFLEKRNQIFMVIDELGGLGGLITLEDVLEEILGKEIVDETDKVVDMRDLAQAKRAKVLGEKPRTF